MAIEPDKCRERAWAQFTATVPASHGPIRVITAIGEIDRSNVADLAALTENPAETIGSSLILDFSEVTFIDGGGLDLISDLLDRCRGDQWLGILSANTHLRRMLEISGLAAEKALRVFESGDPVGSVLC
jgi:anti-anti-sigma factor